MISFSFFSPDDTPSLTMLGTVFFYLTNFISLSISIALIPLTLRIIVQLYNNLTTIEMMKNKQVKYPCIGARDNRTPDGRLESQPNEYDMLWLQNMKQVMGTSLWMWPFPFQQEMSGKGLYFPRIPEVTPGQARILAAQEDSQYPAELASQRSSRSSRRSSYSGTDFETDP